MKSFNVAILGCGTVGGGVAQIILQMQKELTERVSGEINLKRIVEINPKKATLRFDLPLELFAGSGGDLSKDQASEQIKNILASKDIDMVVETIGGTSDFVHQLCIDICKSGKHLITANKSLLAERGKEIFDAARENNVFIGYEAAVCGAIPIIKTIKESFSGDSIQSISGIFNGTSNYILSQMTNEGLEFHEALRLAQENGYAEADPTLDINGGDAAHKLVLLIKLAFGIDLDMNQLSQRGIQDITKEDIEFAAEMGCKLKLICYAKRIDGKLYATVCPMMVKGNNFLSEVNGATNAVRVVNKYSGRHVLVGAGAGSSETASSIVADIVFAARYADRLQAETSNSGLEITDAKHFQLPYVITFETLNKPGITGLISTALGNQQINIDTMSHNRHVKERALFSIATMPCTMQQIQDAIDEIRKTRGDILIGTPKIIPILH